MGDNEQPIAQKIIPTIVASLIIAGVLGSVSAWNNSRENTIRIENAMVAMGVLSSNQSEIAKNLNEISRQLSVLDMRADSNKRECEILRRDMEKR